MDRRFKAPTGIDCYRIVLFYESLPLPKGISIYTVFLYYKYNELQNSLAPSPASMQVVIPIFSLKGEGGKPQFSQCGGKNKAGNRSTSLYTSVFQSRHTGMDAGIQRHGR